MQQSRDTLIAQTTQRLLADWHTELKAGNKRAINDLHNTVLDKLTEDDAKAIFIQSAIDEAGAERGFHTLVAKAMAEVCEADATRTVDILLADLVEQREDDRIARALDARAA